jgi:hypothetical protein
MGTGLSGRCDVMTGGALENRAGGGLLAGVTTVTAGGEGCAAFGAAAAEAGGVL